MADEDIEGVSIWGTCIIAVPISVREFPNVSVSSSVISYTPYLITGTISSASTSPVSVWVYMTHVLWCLVSVCLSIFRI